MAVETTSITKIDLNSIRITRAGDDSYTKIMNLEIGHGFEIKGMDRERVSAKFTYIQARTNKRFGVRKLGDRHFLVFRKPDHVEVQKP